MSNAHVNSHIWLPGTLSQEDKLLYPSDGPSAILIPLANLSLDSSAPAALRFGEGNMVRINFV